jgi:hypothetical protein
LFRVTVRGASGGSSLDYEQLGGYPTVITATFRLSPGFLKIAVGQQGQCHRFDGLSGKKSRSVVCGGGGGTFVVSDRDTEPLLIAGGGGGAGDNGPGKSFSLFFILLCSFFLYKVPTMLDKL